MLRKLTALMLLSTPAFAGWNVDSSHMLSTVMIDDGVMLQHRMQSAVSPFEAGPQLEISLGTSLIRQRFSQPHAGRYALGLRQELGQDYSVSVRAVTIDQDLGPIGPLLHSTRLGMEAAIDWRIWTAPPIGTHIPIGLNLVGYAGTIPDAGRPLTWAGTGIALAFGR